MRFQPKAKAKMAISRNRMVHHAPNMSQFLAVLIVTLHSAAPVQNPKPGKLSVESDRTTLPTSMDARIKAGAITLGSMCLKIIAVFEVPKAFQLK